MRCNKPGRDYKCYLDGDICHLETCYCYKLIESHKTELGNLSNEEPSYGSTNRSMTNKEYAMFVQCKSFFAGVALGQKEKAGDKADKILTLILDMDAMDVLAP